MPRTLKELVEEVDPDYRKKAEEVTTYRFPSSRKGGQAREFGYTVRPGEPYPWIVGE